MTTLNATDARIPPDCFNRVAYQNEVVRVVRHNGRGGEVYLISADDWKLLEELKAKRDAAIDAASKRVGEAHEDLMRRLSE